SLGFLYLIFFSGAALPMATTFCKFLEGLPIASFSIFITLLLTGCAFTGTFLADPVRSAIVPLRKSFAFLEFNIDLSILIIKLYYFSGTKTPLTLCFWPEVPAGAVLYNLALSCI